MQYRTVGDLSELVNAYAHRVPHDVDLIVGIPRSGMLVASILSLKLNVPMTDLYSFRRNDPLELGAMRHCRGKQLSKPLEAAKILLVDDSIASGGSMREAVEMTREVYAGEVRTMVAFAMRENTSAVDVFLETVEQPRLFEWNIMHHNLLTYSCMNLDGILCQSPASDTSPDDCAAHLEKCKPLFIPSARIGHLVTGLPETCRGQVEAWLEQQGIRYDRLHMPSATLTRVQDDGLADPFADFAAGVFRRDPHALLMFESCPFRAQVIMQKTNKPVFCVPANRMYTPGFSWLSLVQPALRKTLTLRDKALGRMRGLMGTNPA